MTLNELRTREHWSFSAINAFLTCGLKGAFDYVYKLERKWVPSNLSFGSTFHHVTDWVNMNRREGTTFKKEAAVDLFSELWKRQLADDGEVRFGEDQDAESLAEQGRALTQCFVESLDENERVVAVNQPFAVPLIDAQGITLDRPLIGEIDSVVENDHQQVELVDTKTSATRWAKDKADRDLQPSVYLLGWHGMTGEIPPFRFDVVVKNKKPVFEQHVTQRTTDDFRRVVELVKGIERLIKAEAFLPNESSFFCKGCVHAEACESWHRNKAKLISVAA